MAVDIKTCGTCAKYPKNEPHVCNKRFPVQAVTPDTPQCNMFAERKESAKPSMAYCINCKYGIDTDFCRRDLKTELHANTKACEKFVKAALKPRNPGLIRTMGVYRNNFEMVQELQKIIPIHFDESRNFWAWQPIEKYYKRIDKTDIINRTSKETGEYVVDSTMYAEVIRAAEITGRDRQLKEVNKNWVHCKDYVFDISTKNQFEATPEYFYPAPIPHKIGLDEATPTIDKLFKDWMGEDATKLYEICAYCLIDAYPIHRMFILFGRGRNGKGQFLNFLERFIGEENTISTDLELLCESRFESSKLYKKKLATIGETDFNAIKNTGKLKMLTGDDKIGGEFKGKELFNFHNTAKIVIASNGLPESMDKSDGFNSRCVILEFKNQFDEGKSIIESIPEIEYENMLLKCLNMLPRLLERGRFTNEGTIEEKAQKYEKLSNPFPVFKEKELIEDINADCPVWVIKELYEAYCVKNGYRKLGNREFTQQLKKEGFETKYKWYGKHHWSTVIGLSTKEPFIYSEDKENFTTTENQERVVDVALVVDSSNHLLCNTSVESIYDKHDKHDRTDNTVTDLCGICNNPLNGNSERISRLGLIHPSCKHETRVIKVLKDIPTFADAEGIRRSLKAGDVVSLPVIVAMNLVYNKVAVKEGW